MRIQSASRAGADTCEHCICSQKSHNDNVSLPSYPAGRECMQGCMRAAG